MTNLLTATEVLETMYNHLTSTGVQPKDKMRAMTHFILLSIGVPPEYHGTSFIQWDCTKDIVPARLTVWEKEDKGSGRDGITTDMNGCPYNKIMSKVLKECQAANNQTKKAKK